MNWWDKLYVTCSVCKESKHWKEMGILYETDQYFSINWGSYAHICKKCHPKDSDSYQDLPPDQIYTPENKGKHDIDWAYYVEWRGKCHLCGNTPTPNDFCVSISHVYIGAGKTRDNFTAVGHHLLCLDCAMDIRDTEGTDYTSFRDKLYCCSMNPQIEHQKYKQKLA